MLRRRPSLPFIERWRNRHGRMRIYFRRRGSKRIALTGDYGSDDFHASYARALNGDAGDDDRPEIVRPGNGTLAALIASYRQDAAFTGLRPTTKAGYLLAARHHPARTWRAFGDGPQSGAHRDDACRL